MFMLNPEYVWKECYLKQGGVGKTSVFKGTCTI